MAETSENGPNPPPPVGSSQRSASAGRHQRRLKNFALDRLQFRYTAVLVVSAAGLLLGLGSLVYRFAREATEAARLTVMATVEDGPGQAAILQAIQQSDRRLLGLLIGAGVLLLLLLGFCGLIMTHKVAGPLHRMMGLLDRVREGKLTSDVGSLRKGDELQRFYTLFKAMLESLRMSAESERDRLNEVVSELEQLDLPPSAAPALDKLRAIKQDKESRLI